MSNENKIRILYVQPANIRRNGSLQMSCPPSAACRRGYASRIPVVKGQCGACLQRFGQGGRSAAEPLH